MIFKEPLEQYVGRWFHFIEDEHVNSTRGLIAALERSIYFPIIFIDTKNQRLKYHYFRVVLDDGSPIIYSVEEYCPTDDELVMLSKHILSSAYFLSDVHRYCYDRD
jgi:hypothetical protein